MQFSLKLDTKDSFRYKKVKKLLFLTLKFYEQEQSRTAKLTGFSNQNNLKFLEIFFRTFLPSSAKHFLGVSAQASLEVATKVFFKKLSLLEINIFEANILKKQPE